MAHRRPAAGTAVDGAGTAVDGEGVSASIDGLAPPSSVHQITGTVSLYPVWVPSRYLKANVVAVFERLAQFRNTLRDDVAGHNVPGPDVFDKLVPAKHFPDAGKKTRRSIKRGSRVSWRPFLLIWFTEGLPAIHRREQQVVAYKKAPDKRERRDDNTFVLPIFAGVTLRH